MHEMKNMSMTKREFTNTAKRYAKKYWDITLDIPIKWEYHGRRKAYAWCSAVRIREKGVLQRKPQAIVMNIPNIIDFHDDQLLDALKHELTHWACMKRNKPFSDGSRFFEKELLRIGAPSTGFELSDEGYLMSKSYQKEIVERKVNRKRTKTVEGKVSKVSIYSVFRYGSLVARYDEKEESWNTASNKHIVWFAENTKYFFGYTFLLDGREAKGFIAQLEDGSWTISQRNRKHGGYYRQFHFEDNLEKIYLSKKTQKQLKEIVIPDAENLLDYLMIQPL